MFLNNSRRDSVGKSVGNKKYYYRCVCSVSKSIGNNIFFITNEFTYGKKNYRGKIHRRIISVGDSVGKLITDIICVSRRLKNSVGKTVRSCIVMIFEWRIHDCPVTKPCLQRRHSKSLGALYVMGWRVQKLFFVLSLLFKLNFSPYKNSDQPLQFNFSSHLIHDLMVTIFKILNDL